MWIPLGTAISHPQKNFVYPLARFSFISHCWLVYSYMYSLLALLSYTVIEISVCCTIMNLETLRALSSTFPMFGIEPREFKLPPVDLLVSEACIET